MNIITYNNNYKKCNNRCTLKDITSTVNLLPSLQNYLDLQGVHYWHCSEEVPSIKYNNLDYYIKTILIQEGTFLFFDSVVCDIFYITAQNMINGKTLAIGIPIKGVSTISNSPLDKLISDKKQMTEDNKYFQELMLKNILPKKTPYYIIETENEELIVFSNKNPIYIDYNNLFQTHKENIKKKRENLQKSFDKGSLDLSEKVLSILVNKKGIEKSKNVQDDIYIECNPTDQHGELLVKEDKSLIQVGSTAYDKLKDLLKNINIHIDDKVVKSILFAFLGLIIFIIISIILHYTMNSMEKYSKKPGDFIINDNSKK